MSLYKRGNTWWISITAPNGQRIRRSARTQSREAAQEYHDRLKAELWRVHTLGEKPRRTWQDAVKRWIREKEHKADIAKDVAKLKWLHPFLGDCYLDEINRDLVDRIAEAKKAESSASTVNRYLALLRAILRAARDDWEWIDSAPRVRLYPEPKRRVRWITREEARRLLSALPSHLEAMAAFSLATGLRQSNVSSLRWEQLDMARGMAWIHADQSKSGRAIGVPLNEDAVSILRKRQGIDDTYVFTYRGKPIACPNTRAWRLALQKAGIKDFRWHDLRHTWASWHVQNGTSLQELQELGGWSSFEMVLRYAHLSADHLKQVASRIEGTISSHPVQSGTLRKVVSY